MPKRILAWSRTEPARTILLLVALATMALQMLTLLPAVSPTFWPVVPNVLLVAAVCVWGIWASWTSNIKHMPRATFWLFFMWVWSGLTRLAFSPDPAMLLWGPFLVVALALGVCYIYLSGEKKRLGG